MKTIGIIMRRKSLDSNDYYVSESLLKFLNKYPIEIINIPVHNKNMTSIKQTINNCDGIIFPGGKHRNDLDYEIIEYLFNINKPTLGICLGMQTMGKTFNNHVIGKVSNHRISQRSKHKVKISKDSLLYEIINSSEISVNSLHDYALPNNCSYTPLNIVACDQDGIVEAIENKNKIFLLVCSGILKKCLKMKIAKNFFLTL